MVTVTVPLLVRRREEEPYSAVQSPIGTGAADPSPKHLASLCV